MKVNYPDNLIDKAAMFADDISYQEIKYMSLVIKQDHQDNPLEIEIVNDKKKGWLYSYVRDFIFKINGEYQAVRATELRKVVEEGCKEKQYSETPEPFKLTRSGGRITTLVPQKNIPFY